MLAPWDLGEEERSLFQLRQPGVGGFSFEVRLSWPLIVLILSSLFLGGHLFFQVCLRERHESKAFWKTCWNPQEPKVYVFVTSLARSCVCCRELLDAPHGDQCSHASNGQLDGDSFTDLLKELKTDWLNTKSTGRHYLLLFCSSNSDKVLFVCWSFVDVHQILNYLCNWSSSVDSVVIFYLSKRQMKGFACSSSPGIQTLEMYPWNPMMTN